MARRPIQKINSRAKGAAGEREFAQVLKEYGLEARRGQQFSGSKDSPDVVCSGLTGVHFEVKRVQKGSPYDWLEQAKNDAGGSLPIVAWRRNNHNWVGILDLADLLHLLIIREGTLL